MYIYIIIYIYIYTYIYISHLYPKFLTPLDLVEIFQRRGITLSVNGSKLSNRVTFPRHGIKVSRKRNTHIWVNYNDLTATSLEIMVNKGNHPQMVLIQVRQLIKEWKVQNRWEQPRGHRWHRTRALRMELSMGSCTLGMDTDMSLAWTASRQWPWHLLDGNRPCFSDPTRTLAPLSNGSDLAGFSPCRRLQKLTCLTCSWHWLSKPPVHITSCANSKDW